MRPFLLNGRVWIPVRVSDDSNFLIDRTGERRLATTDPENSLVFIAACLHGEMLERVMIHEACHCFLISYGLIHYVYNMAPNNEWNMEEWICNLVADSAIEIINAAKFAIRR